MEIYHRIAQNLEIPICDVVATIELLDGGSTVPFIARYRKEATGSLDEDQIRKVESLLESLRNLEGRRKTIFSSIESQGKLTAALRTKIEKAETRTELEDLYPESTMFGELPAFAFFIRHGENISLSDITVTTIDTDTRKPVLTQDVRGIRINNVERP